MALVELSFFSPLLEQNARVFVALPELAEVGAGERLKTVWMLHGYSGSCSDWQRLSGIERHAVARRCAVVMPDAENSFYADMAYGKPWFTYLTQELPDYLRRILPLSDKREDNFIGGLSSGGYGAMKIALTCPERFAAVACLSAYNIPEDFSWQYPDKPEGWRRMFRLCYGDLFPDHMMGSAHDLWTLAERVLAEGKPAPRIYHVWGDRDVAKRGALLMQRFFTERGGFEYVGKEYPGVHDFNFWDARLPEMFDFFGFEDRILAPMPRT